MLYRDRIHGAETQCFWCIRIVSGNISVIFLAIQKFAIYPKIWYNTGIINKEIFKITVYKILH